MNNYDIKLLCPPKKCGKCRRMIKRVEETLKIEGIEDEIKIINKPDEVQQYPTWLLPTLIINDKVAARGYVPTREKLRNFL